MNEWEAASNEWEKKWFLEIESIPGKKKKI